MDKGLLKTILDTLMGLTKETDTLQKNIQSLADKESRFQIINKTKYPERSPNEEFIDAISNSNFKQIPKFKETMFDNQVAAKQRENAALDALLNQLASGRLNQDPIVEQKQEPEIKENRTDTLVKTKRRIQVEGEEQ